MFFTAKRQLFAFGNCIAKHDCNAIFHRFSTGLPTFIIGNFASIFNKILSILTKVEPAVRKLTIGLEIVCEA